MYDKLCNNQCGLTNPYMTLKALQLLIDYERNNPDEISHCKQLLEAVEATHRAIGSTYKKDDKTWSKIPKSNNLEK